MDNLLFLALNTKQRQTGRTDFL